MNLLPPRHRQKPDTNRLICWLSARFLLLALFINATTCFIFALSRPAISDPAALLPAPSWAGTWTIWGGEKHKTDGALPWLKGTLLSFSWQNLEPNFDNKFDFSNFDRNIKNAIQNDLYVGILVYHNPNMYPKWLFETTNIPPVRVRAQHYGGVGSIYQEDDIYTFPYYLHDEWQEQLQELYNAIADHISSYPEAWRRKIVQVQVPLGKSGDPQPWDGTVLDVEYAIHGSGTRTDDYWNNNLYEQYYIISAKNIERIFDVERFPNLSILINPLPKYVPAIRRAAPRIDFKGTVHGQRYQLTNERWTDPLRTISRPGATQLGERVIRKRGEFDRAATLIDAPQPNWFREAPQWNVYWTALSALNAGNDIWNLHPKMLGDNPEQFRGAFDFFNQYAGQKVPEKATGAWIAFRDGLNSANLARFPEPVYGAFDRRRNSAGYKANSARNQRIADAFRRFGARQGDNEATGYDAFGILRFEKSLNDVYQDMIEDNYAMYINQIQPEQTSLGYWRVGDTDQPYGRFARGFPTTASNAGLYLDVEDRFLYSLAGQQHLNLDLRVVYFDAGHGSWSISYDAIDEPDKILTVIDNTDTQRWKEVVISISDAFFGNRGPRGADLSLRPVSVGDVRFHMVELICNASGCPQPQ